MGHFLKQKLFLALIVFGVIALASPVLAVGISVGYPNPIPLLAGENLYYGASTGGLGNLILLQVDSVIKFSVDPTGAISLYGDIKPGGVSCANNQILQKIAGVWVCASLPSVAGDNLGNHTATQTLIMGNFKITNLAPPTVGTDAATMAYVDAKPGDNLGNHTATINLDMSGKLINGLAAPAANTDAANKLYVDTAVANTGWADNGTVVRLITATDNVGIGTASAARKLSILDGVSGPIVSLSGLTTNYRGLSLRRSSDDAENWFMGANSANNFVVRRNGATDDLTIDSSGALSIYGDIKPNGASCANNQILQKIAGVWVCAAVTGDNLGNHTATANLNMNTVYKIINLAVPTLATDATTKAYVDARPGDNLGNHIATQILSMGNFKITNLATPTLATDATTKAYVDALPGDNLGNHIATANLNMNTTYKITNLATPTAGTDATTKAYVDTAVAANTGWADDGTVVRLITATDNVGIGTALPTSKLQIAGVGGSTIDLDVSGRIRSNSASGGLWLSNAGDFVGMNGNNIGFYTNGSWNAFQIVKATGNVGIGNIAPTQKLDVTGNINTSGNITASGNITMTGQQLNHNADNSLFINSYDALQLRINADGLGTSVFGINNSANSQVVTVTNAGNVGIGTTNPSARLHIQGSGTGNVLLGELPGDAAYGSIYLNGLTQGINYNFRSSPGDTNLYINRPLGGSIIFREADNATGNYVVITTGGNVGIGVANPTSRLDVANNAHISNNLTADNNINAGNNMTVGGNLRLDLRQKTCIHDFPTAYGTYSCDCSEYGSNYIILTGGATCKSSGTGSGNATPDLTASFPANLTTWSAACGPFNAILPYNRLEISIVCAPIQDSI